jgi:hypothetical protein
VSLNHISPAEAKLRFSVGHHFRVNDKIGKKSVFLPGDIVKLKSLYSFMETWGINCEFVKQVQGERLSNLFVDNLALHSSYLEDAGVDEPLICTCDIIILMRAGCQCPKNA